MEIDPRGPRLSAVITTIVLAVVLITGSAWLLAAQVAVFAVGALAGLRYAPYCLVYRYLLRPRLGPPARTYSPRPISAARSGRRPRWSSSPPSSAHRAALPGRSWARWRAWWRA